MSHWVPSVRPPMTLQVYATNHYLLNHFKDYHEQRLHKCNICQKTFQSKVSLHYHVKGQHQEKRSHQCNECEKRYSSAGHLKRHVDSIHRKKSYQCDSCTKSYSMKDTLNEHIKDVHEGRTSSCKVCKKVYHSRASLTSHLKSHMNEAANSIWDHLIIKPYKFQIRWIPYYNNQRFVSLSF